MAERGYWIGVAARDHVQVGVAGGFCMFAHGSNSAARRLSAGDRFAYYSPMTGMGTGEPVRAFTAIGEVLPGEPTVREMMAGEGWQRLVRYVASREADIYPLLPQLSFVHDRQHWGMYFRKSLFKIDPSDFEVIASAMAATFD